MNVEFSMALQTNATLLTDDWIQSLEDNEDLLSERMVSISIDGPQGINDETRITRQSGSSYQMTMDAMERIRNSKLSFSTISVIGTHNVNKPDEVYNFINDLKPHLSKFIPCYNFNSSGLPERYGINPVQYANFMCKIFDLWMHDLPNKDPKHWFVVDPIATIIAVLTGSFVTWCEFREEKCDNFMSLYPDGGLWLCDNFDRTNSNLLDAIYLGNLFGLSDDELVRTLLQPRKLCSYGAFYRQSMEECTRCEIQKFCHGGCISRRASLRTRSASLAADYCEGKRILIEYIKRGVSLALSQS